MRLLLKKNHPISSRKLTSIVYNFPALEVHLQYYYSEDLMLQVLPFYTMDLHLQMLFDYHSTSVSPNFSSHRQLMELMKI